MKKNVPLMESTRFIYLSMAMFTRTDAMFHSCYLKQNKKNRLCQKYYIYFHGGGSDIFFWVVSRKLLQGLGQLCGEKYTINVLTIVFQINV